MPNNEKATAKPFIVPAYESGLKEIRPENAEIKPHNTQRIRPAFSLLERLTKFHHPWSNITPILSGK